MPDTTADTTADPRPARRRRLQPRHGVYLVLLAVVVASIVVLVQKASTNGVNLDNGNIERLIPTPDSKILQQDQIGIDLGPGYTGTLALNGTQIPEDQLLLVPELNQVIFAPGPGKDYEQLPAGQNCVTATYWLSSTGPSQSTIKTWCFTVL